MKRRVASAPPPKAPPAKQRKAAPPVASNTRKPVVTRKQAEAAAAAEKKKADEIAKDKRKRAEAAAAAEKKKADEIAKEKRKRAEAAAAADKKKADEIAEEKRKQAEAEAMAAKKRANEERVRKIEEAVRKAAEARALAKKQADMAAAKTKAPGAVKAARQQAETAEAVAQKMAEESEVVRQAVETAAAEHRLAENAHWSAQRVAEKAALEARKLIEAAAAAQKVAELAAAVAMDARNNAEKEGETAKGRAAEAAKAMRRVEKEAARVAAQKTAEEDAVRSRAEEELRIVDELKALCRSLDLRVAEDRTGIMEVLEGYLAQEEAAAAAERRAQDEKAAKAAAEKQAAEEEEEAVRRRAQEEAAAAERRAQDEKAAQAAAEKQAAEEEAVRRRAQEEAAAAAAAERRAQDEKAAKAGAEKQAAEEEAVRRRAAEEAATVFCVETSSAEGEEEETTRGTAEAAAVERGGRQDEEEVLLRAAFDQIAPTSVSPRPAKQPRVDAELPPAVTPLVGTAKALSSSSSAVAKSPETNKQARRKQVDADLCLTFPAPKAEGNSFADVAAARHQELGREIAAKREVLARKLAEVQRAEAARSSAAARMNAAEEAARPDVKQKEEALAAATKSVETCSSESSAVKAVRASFMELQEAPLEPATLMQSNLNALKPRLKIVGVGQDAIDRLAPVLAKKRRLKSDHKVLSSIDEALAVRDRATAFMLGKCMAEVARCEEAVAVVAAASQARARELSRFDEVLKAREAERRSCEEQVSAVLCELSEHEGRMTKEGLIRFSLSGEQCAICCNDLSAGAAVRLGCNHGWYCPECMKRFVDARLDAGIAGDVPCPDCGMPISEKDLITLLPRNTILRLHARSIQQKDVASGARACPTPNCPWRLSLNADGSGERQTCPLCEVESCLLCGTAPYHEGRTCEEHRNSLHNQDEQSFLKWMEATGSKQCPTCKMATTKENLEKQSQQRSECHKMLCRNCGTRFCFKCLAILTETYTCGCTIDRHGFIDPHTGKIIKHLRRGKRRAG